MSSDSEGRCPKAVVELLRWLDGQTRPGWPLPEHLRDRNAVAYATSKGFIMGTSGGPFLLAAGRALLAELADKPAGGGADEHPLDDKARMDALVTLAQVAPLTGLRKRTLERYLHFGRLPKPDVQGGDGKSNKWLWCNLRPKLAAVAKRPLPERFPGSQIIT